MSFILPFNTKIKKKSLFQFFLDTLNNILILKKFIKNLESLKNNNYCFSCYIIKI